MTDKTTLSLLRDIKNGNEDAFDALAYGYSALIESASRTAFGKRLENDDVPDVGISLDDFRQEARLALYRAAVTYDPDGDGREVTFGLYAKVCIKNAMISELRREQSKKRRAKRARLDVNSMPHEDISADAFLGERLSDILERSDSLSPYERKVLDLHLSGKAPREVAEILGCSPKSVSNALYRIRSKIKLALSSGKQ